MHDISPRELERAMERDKTDAGYASSIAMKKVWAERKSGIRKWNGRPDAWYNDNEAYSPACNIQEDNGLPIGIIPILHKAIANFKLREKKDQFSLQIDAIKTGCPTICDDIGKEGRCISILKSPSGP